MSVSFPAEIDGGVEDVGANAGDQVPSSFYKEAPQLQQKPTWPATSGFWEPHWVQVIGTQAE